MEPASEELIAQIRAGDTAAFADFLQAHRQQLLAFISRNLGPALRSKIEAEDIFQEVSVDALKRLGELAEGDRDIFGWLCQTAEHRLIDAHRRLFGAQKRSGEKEVALQAPVGSNGQSPLINLLVASMTTASQAFSRSQKEIQLLEALATLPEESREALRLRYVEGLPSKEIAARLGKSDGAIRVLLTRSLSRLQSVMQ
jgi:RNA polymerase sigma-70 factor, ECF subfamily